jgi:hypothetical protein
MEANTLRMLTVALAVAVAGVMPAPPAAAQFSAARTTLAAPPGAEPVQFREFFHFPFIGGGRAPSYYNPFFQPRPPQNFESNKAPPPRKVETPPTSTILVIGDSFADWLGYGLEQAFADTPEIGIVRKVRPYSGLVRYEPGRAEGPEWSDAVKEMLATEKPSAIVVMLGINDRLSLRERATPPAGKGATPTQEQGTTPSAAEGAHADGAHNGPAANEPQRRFAPAVSYEFHTDKWAELYAKRIDEMIAALKTKGVPVLWVGLPAVRGNKSTSDMSYLDELYRARADKAGITYVDIWDGFVDERGVFAVQGPDFEGQIRRLRSFDGVYFTKAGAEKLAHYVEHELRRVMTSHAVPVALPAPEEQAPGTAKATGTRPAVGPVVPLSAIAPAAGGGDLLGATNHPAQHDSDPIAARVFTRGEAIAAPQGRADDFSWPRADAGGGRAAAPALGTPSAPLPASGGDGAVKGGPRRSDANKPDVKEPGRAAPAGRANVTSAPADPAREALDGAAQPPLSIVPAPADVH